MGIQFFNVVYSFISCSVHNDFFRYDLEYLCRGNLRNICIDERSSFIMSVSCSASIFYFFIYDCILILARVIFPFVWIGDEINWSTTCMHRLSSKSFELGIRCQGQIMVRLQLFCGYWVGYWLGYIFQNLSIIALTLLDLLDLISGRWWPTLWQPHHRFPSIGPVIGRKSAGLSNVEILFFQIFI